MPVYFEVCGTPALAAVEGLLRAAGYRPTEARPRAPGEYRTDRIDAAPGWADWTYEVEVIELPAAPVAEIVARVK